MANVKAWQQPGPRVSSLASQALETQEPPDQTESPSSQESCSQLWQLITAYEEQCDTSLVLSPTSWTDHGDFIIVESLGGGSSMASQGPTQPECRPSGAQQADATWGCSGFWQLSWQVRRVAAAKAGRGGLPHQHGRQRFRPPINCKRSFCSPQTPGSQVREALSVSKMTLLQPTGKGCQKQRLNLTQ